MHRSPFPRIAAGTAALALALAACSSDNESGEDSSAAGYPLTVDNCGEELVIESEPQTVMTIGTSAIALLDAAGASDRIIARAGEFGSELPQGLEQPPSDAEIVDPADPTAEKIIGAGADIVVGYGLFNAAPEDLEAVGTPNVVIEGECNHDEAAVAPIDFDAVFADIERLGRIFGTEETARASVEEMRAAMSELESDVPAERRSAAVVYYFSAAASMSARGGLSISSDILDRAGLDDVYGDEQAAYLEASFETLLDADPEVVVLAYGLYGESFEEAREQFLSEPGADDLQAVRDGLLIGVPASDLYADPGALRGLRAVLEGSAT